MRLDQFDVRHLQGKAARLQIVDNQQGGWGNIGVGEIVLSDKPLQAPVKFEDRHDYGTMALALLDPGPTDRGVATLPDSAIPAELFTEEPRIPTTVPNRSVNSCVAAWPALSHWPPARK